MDLRESIHNQIDFSLFLTKHVISTQARDKNLVFSPLSIHVVLGLIAAGSGGQARDQMLDFLQSKSTEELNFMSSQLVTLIFADGWMVGGPRLSFANGVWVDQSLSLKNSFKEVVENDYKAASGHVDFRNRPLEVTKEVNTWAETRTSGLIKEILPPGVINAFTRLVFANAVYFKGEWKEKFDPSKTKSYPFFLLNGTSVQAPFLTSWNDQYISAFKNFKVLGLPYKQGGDNRKFTLYAFLPNAKDGLSSLVERLGSELNFLDRHLPYRQVRVGDFRVPKFKISFGFEASEILKSLGLVLPFYTGGLTEMVDSSSLGKELCVSNIFHKSFIKVNEEGTEAAAASISMAFGCATPMKLERMDFVADHPFLFVIREDLTGVVLFVGQILDPLSE